MKCRQATTHPNPNPNPHPPTPTSTPTPHPNLNHPHPHPHPNLNLHPNPNPPPHAHTHAHTAWYWFLLEVQIYGICQKNSTSINVLQSARPTQQDRWLHVFEHTVIKSPRYTGVDFMFLYRFVRRRRSQILVHVITFEQLFGFLSFLARVLALTCRLAV